MNAMWWTALIVAGMLGAGWMAGAYLSSRIECPYCGEKYLQSTTTDFDGQLYCLRCRRMLTVSQSNLLDGKD